MKSKLSTKAKNAGWSLIVGGVLVTTACSSTQKAESIQNPDALQLLRARHVQMLDRAEFGHGGVR